VLEEAKIEKKRDLKERTFTDVDKHITLKSIQLLMDRRVVVEVKKALSGPSKNKDVSISNSYDYLLQINLFLEEEKISQSNEYQRPKSGHHWKWRCLQEAKQARYEGRDSEE